jgi:predicted amidophosphoribosyltransferase
VDFLSFIFPKRCIGCGKIGRYFCEKCIRTIRIIQTNEAICPVCEKPAIDGVTHPRCGGRYALDGLTSFYHYHGIIRQAIKQIKYRFVSDLADELVNQIPLTSYNIVIKQVKGRPAFLLPIPLHISRLRFRGFNQAEILGLRISKILRIPLKHDILNRIKASIPQVEMKNRPERIQNMEKVFGVNNSVIQQFKSDSRTSSISISKSDIAPLAYSDKLKSENQRYPAIVLFDDVFTTGATMRSAAFVLKHVGVKFVWAVTLAR